MFPGFKSLRSYWKPAQAGIRLAVDLFDPLPALHGHYTWWDQFIFYEMMVELYETIFEIPIKFKALIS